jgi:hypothetical protein
MAATYPEMFAAGVVYSGVAAGCFLSQSGGTDQWNNSCAQGQAIGTPEVWAKVNFRTTPTYLTTISQNVNPYLLLPDGYGYGSRVHW